MPRPPALFHQYRRRLALSSEIITHSPQGQDEGRVLNESLSRLGRRIALSRRDARMLFHLAHFFKPEIILELGGGLGHSSLALHSGAPHARMMSIEGDQEVARAAIHFLREAGVEDVEIVAGRFREVLPTCMASLGKPDLVFLDGDHRLDETVYLSQEILPMLSPHGVLAIHDIHASDEMIEAWNLVRGLPEVTASATTWSTGFLFVNEGLSRQHFNLRN